MPRHRAASIAEDEIGQFSRHAGDWWNPDGVFRPLHRLNPARLEYLRDKICDHFGGSKQRLPFKGLSILDVGCGGGLLTEPMARLGGTVTGLDASAEGIEAARRHAQQMKLEIKYIIGSIEEHAQGFGKNGKVPPPLRGRLGGGARSNPNADHNGGPPPLTPPARGGEPHQYDVVTALEIAEHVADLDSFLAAVGRLLKPNGLLILSTLNRTAKSFLLGIVAAEYILRWVPRGTHNWRKFIKPSELASQLENQGLSVTDITGMGLDPVTGEFTLRQGDVGMNYLMTAVKD